MSRSGKRASVYICQERFLKGPRSLDLVQEVLAFVLFCFVFQTRRTRLGQSSLGSCPLVREGLLSASRFTQIAGQAHGR